MRAPPEPASVSFGPCAGSMALDECFFLIIRTIFYQLMLNISLQICAPSSIDTVSMKLAMMAIHKLR